MIVPKKIKQSPATETGKVDYVLDSMLKNGIPVTQRNYLEICYFGAKSSLDDLDAEELADLPDDFLHWPVDELGRVN
jgi:hypothetical protein